MIRWAPIAPGRNDGFIHADSGMRIALEAVGLVHGFFAKMLGILLRGLLRATHGSFSAAC